MKKLGDAVSVFSVPPENQPLKTMTHEWTCVAGDWVGMEEYMCLMMLIIHEDSLRKFVLASPAFYYNFFVFLPVFLQKTLKSSKINRPF